jgi:hypothetical protein
MCKFGIIPGLFATTFGMTFGKTSYCVNLIDSKNSGFFSGDINLGYTTQADITDADLTYGLAVVYSIGKFDIGAEINGTQEMANWQFGLRLVITDWLILDSGVVTTIAQSPILMATSGLWMTF